MYTIQLRQYLIHIISLLTVSRVNIKIFYFTSISFERIATAFDIFLLLNIFINLRLVLSQWNIARTLQFNRKNSTPSSHTTYLPQADFYFLLGPDSASGASPPSYVNTQGPGRKWRA